MAEGHSTSEMGVMSEKQKKEVTREDVLQIARLNRGVIEYLNKYPFSSDDELAQASGAIYWKERYPAALKLVDVALHSRRLVTNARQELLASRSDTSLSTMLFDGLKQNPDYILQGKVYVSGLDSPFAVQIGIQKREDFAQIDPRDTVGHFNSGVIIKHSDGTMTVFPAIVYHAVYPDQDAGVIRHEMGHVYNYLIQDVMRRTGKEQRWSQRPSKKDPDLGVVQKSLRLAKDEILAGMFENADPGRITERLTESKLYDYVGGEHIEDSYREEALRKYFTEVLEAEMDEVENVWQAYTNRNDQQSKELLPWILQQFPLGQWKQSIEKFDLVEATSK